MPTKDISTRAAYIDSYSWMRATYSLDTEAAQGQSCLTKETQAAKTSFLMTDTTFTGWVNKEREAKFVARWHEIRYAVDPYYDIPF